MELFLPVAGRSGGPYLMARFFLEWGMAKLFRKRRCKPGQFVFAAIGGNGKQENCAEFDAMYQRSALPT